MRGLMFLSMYLHIFIGKILPIFVVKVLDLNGDLEFLCSS